MDQQQNSKRPIWQYVALGVGVVVVLAVVIGQFFEITGSTSDLEDSTREVQESLEKLQ